MPISAQDVAWDAPTIDPATVKWDEDAATKPSFGEQIFVPYRNLANVATEVPLAIGTGAIGTLLGNVAGFGREVLTGDFGKGTAERTARKVQEALTYAPRNPTAREALTQLGGVIKESKLEGLPIAGQEIPAIGRAMRQGVPAARELASAKISAPSQAMLKFAKENQPKIEAGKKMQALGLVYDVAETNPTLKNVVGAEFARPQVIDIKASIANRPVVQRTLMREAGVEGDVLTGKTLEEARTTLSQPYNEVRKLGALAPNNDIANAIRQSIPEPIVGLEKDVSKIAKVADRVATAVENGELTASKAVDAIRAYRDTAKNWYKVAEKGDAKRNPLPMAKGYERVADTLEDLIAANIPESSPLLPRFKKARESLAKNYAVEGLINTESGLPELARFNTPRFADAPLTGDLADLRTAYANFPEALQSVGKYGALLPNTISRSSAGGTTGAGAAIAMGGSPAAGGILGAASGLLGGRVVANRMLSPAYQQKNAMPFVPGARRAEPTTLTLAPVGAELLPSVNIPQPPQGRGLLSLADETPSTSAPYTGAVEMPVEPRFGPLYAPKQAPTGLQLVPKEAYPPNLQMPVVSIAPEGRGLLTSEPGAGIPRTPDARLLSQRHDVPTVEFTLRQEVLNDPVIMGAFDDFAGRASELQFIIKNAIDKKAIAQAKTDLAALQKEFMVGLKQLGIKSEKQARGLATRALYERAGRGRTQRGVISTFDPRSNK
jgi:hypothetical protein